jgi:hypothetical protein
MKNLMGVFAVVLMCVAASSAQAVDLTGTWVVDGKDDRTVTVVKDSATEFTGTYLGTKITLTVTLNEKRTDYKIRAVNGSGNAYDGRFEIDETNETIIKFTPDFTTGAEKEHKWKRKK